ncbi:hypothetical protein GCK72_019552 [Caenorhabditis remanei]|uniref:7TM GPCR serpentine receptor class x (Srx) domain-containing protein n=1 Tax=Caenorhabditis remanei TaxID=31234 RepID=A0A6A5GCL6_CAERE|nr:hypothetical protein GCK72_019552 [Caenorhabditis remanei]KAF1752997.1 hypothetical protein GCK72_019552 [Caenorhabditis remanei]
MIVLLIPLFVWLFVSIIDVFTVGWLPYILSISSIAVDLRVNLVTCYFYYTHPVFKKQEMEPKQGTLAKISSASR